jgi:hypothetical protein
VRPRGGSGRRLRRSHHRAARQMPRLWALLTCANRVIASRGDAAACMPVGSVPPCSPLSRRTDGRRDRRRRAPRALRRPRGRPWRGIYGVRVERRLSPRPPRLRHLSLRHGCHRSPAATLASGTADPRPRAGSPARRGAPSPSGSAGRTGSGPAAPAARPSPAGPWTAGRRSRRSSTSDHRHQTAPPSRFDSVWPSSGRGSNTSSERDP